MQEYHLLVLNFNNHLKCGCGLTTWNCQQGHWLVFYICTFSLTSHSGLGRKSLSMSLRSGSSYIICKSLAYQSLSYDAPPMWLGKCFHMRQLSRVTLDWFATMTNDIWGPPNELLATCKECTTERRSSCELVTWNWNQQAPWLLLYN